ncbi:putative transcription regulator mTERF family [Helianthus anomalus]
MFILRQHLRRELFSIYHQKSQLSYSTSTKSSSIDHSTTAIRTEFINYLINTLNFTTASAISSSSKVRRLTTTRYCDSVIHILKNNGFNDSQIKDIVAWIPRVLLYKPNETLEPKIRVFLNLGLTNSDLLRLIKRNPSLFELGLHSRIVPTIDYLRMLVGTDEKVIDIINRSRWLFSTSVALKFYAGNVMLLKSYGFSDEQIEKFVHRNAMHFAQPSKWLTSKLDWVECKMGVSRESNEFFRCFNAIASNSVVNMERKMEVYKSRIVSRCRKIRFREKLRFYMDEVGYTSGYLVTCPSLFSLSLEKRVKPRNEVLKILKERMLLGSKSLITLVNYPELRFQDYLRGFEDEIPGLYETYVSRRR